MVWAFCNRSGFNDLLAVLARLFIGRPPLTTDPETLAGDGSSINYCELPVLDGYEV